MKLVSLASLAVLATTAYAGLEDAKYSTVLTAANFDAEIAKPSEGTLVALFAPWCGHWRSSHIAKA